jgi:hypothetical protein
MTNASTTRNVTRKNRDGFNETTGVRKTTVVKGDRTDKKTHLPVIADLIVQINLPAEFAERDTKGGRGGGIPYQEYQRDCSGKSGTEFIKINSFLGEAAAGKTVTAKVKIGLQKINRGGKQIENYYLKVEETNEAVTHTLQIDVNGLAVIDAQKANEDGVQVIDLSTANPNVNGGFIVTKL